MSKIKYLLASPLIGAPFAVVACGQNVNTPGKIKQDEEITKTASNQLKKLFTHSVLLTEYKIPFSDSSKVDEIYINTFKDKNSQLYKDSLKAFKFYALNKINTDQYYFAEKVVSWSGDRTLNPQEIKSLGPIQPNTIPTENQFEILWINEKTGIRDELEKMLIVNKYFAISDKDHLKKMDKNFKYTKDIKYELKNYLLAKYAVEKKFAQVWSKDPEKEADDSFFTQGYNNLRGADSFNAFWTYSNQPKIVLKNEIEHISGNEDDKKLYGYKGFKSNTNSYSLKWDFESLKAKKYPKELYGYFDVNNNRLVNTKIEPNFVINPYKTNSEQTNTPTLVYVNQIAPIASTTEVELPTVEKDEKNKTKVTLLSFDNTMYKDKLDLLAFLFFLNDATLYETAIKSFAQIGHKIKINKVSETLRKAAKDLTFVELV
ncbi:P60-like lipoprotein [Mycoplasmopsis californica]|uniref:p60-like lipoprotein n=1 Tax=Mycoplasmopsis californica TaxID=2113 RepID=A0A059XR24_9BACT|nr:hypothetical protein [Mycoplasmopsis californica]AIA29238.1 P60-like lipoprotein [Mycoplasmopsis californica]